MKDAYYFSHDSNARHDPKILALRSSYGVKGYGWYWIILEIMREQSDYCLTDNNYLYNALALEMQCKCIIVEKFINDCINEFELFIKEGNKIYSESLIKRMKKADEKIDKARESANKRWSKNDEIKIESDVKNANAMPTQCDSNAINESKVKEKKVKNIKKNTLYPEILEYWNSKKIIAHKVLSSKSISLIKSKLESGYTIDDLKEAIKSYWFITTNPETKDSYWYTYKFTLEDFLNPKNFEKFKDFEAAHTNFLIKEEKRK